MKNVIYKIESIINGKCYIGSATLFKRRLAVHLSDLKYNKHHSPILQNHYNKYGLDDLKISIIEQVDCKENLIIREQYYIDTIKPFFNITKIAGSMLGYKHTKESLKKISETHKGKTIEEWHKQIFRDVNIGKVAWNKGLAGTDAVKVSEETKKKISNSMKGVNTWQKGRKASDETKRKISESNKGKTRNKGNVVWNKNKTNVFSEETKKRISESLKKYYKEKKEKQLDEQ